MARPSLLALVVVAVVAAAAPVLAEQGFLGRVPVVAEKGAVLSAAGPLRLRLSLQPGDPARLDDLAARVPVTRSADSAILRIAGYPGGHDPASPEYLQSSFLVDFDEPPVQALRKSVQRQFGDRPTIDQLASFVARHIDKKNYSRGQDPASVVATRREGDCKAHAVLLAALARTFGIPARVVVGLALASVEGRPAGFGHAWVEVHRKGAWQAADAVEMGPGVSLLRLPISVVSDEGPGYMLSFLGPLSLFDVLEVRVLRDEVQTAVAR